MSISKQSYLIHPLLQDQSYQTSLSPCTVQSIISTSAHFTSSLITLSRRNSSFCILLAMNMTQTPLDSSFGPIYSISSRCALKHPNLTSDYSVPMTTNNVGYFSYKQTVSWLITGKNVISVVLLAYFLVVSGAIVDFLEGFATHSKDAG